jgi:hypothetical protein
MDLLDNIKKSNYNAQYVFINWYHRISDVIDEVSRKPMSL